MSWDRVLLRRGHVVWHCYSCSFTCSTSVAATYHLRTAPEHDDPWRSNDDIDDVDDFVIASESVSMPDLIVVDYPGGPRLEDRP